MPEPKVETVIDSRGNTLLIPQNPILNVNGTFVVKPEIDGKNPAYKSIHSTSITLPLK